MSRESSSQLRNMTQTRTVTGHFHTRYPSSLLTEKSATTGPDPCETPETFRGLRSGYKGSGYSVESVSETRSASLVSRQQSRTQALVKVLIQQLLPVL